MTVHRRRLFTGVVIGLLAGLLSSALPGSAQAPPIRPATQGDFAGLVDIGGRRLYLECRGQGSPTVILEGGFLQRGDIWSFDESEPAGVRSMVLPAVARFTRVCAYDRPGTVGQVDPDRTPPFFPSRSDPAPMPRTAGAMVADLHALLLAAGVPGPYVLVGHSFGGLFARLYASTYPDEVVGLVLVDARHDEYGDRVEPLLTPAQWTIFKADGTMPLEGYPDSERVDAAASSAQIRQARRISPLRPMPLAVLAHSHPFDVPIPDWPTEAFERMWRDLQLDHATLVPQSRFFVARESGHNIHQDQPELVVEAIRQVVVGVRSPDTWYELAACCRPADR